MPEKSSDNPASDRSAWESALRQAREELQAVRRQLVGIREEERRRQAAELHDSIGQGLVAFKLALQHAIDRCGEACFRPLAGELAEVSAQCDVLIAEVRRICQGLYPATLETLGLTAALTHLRDTTQAAGVETQLLCPDGLRTARFPGEVEIALYRIAQEAVTNAIRHGGAGRIHIILEQAGPLLRLTVRDDGAGFDPADTRLGGVGLSSMKERVQACGGELTIQSRPGLTAVCAQLPARPLP